MEKTNILFEDIEYLIIENKTTKEIITKITQNDVDVIEDYIIRIKPIKKAREKSFSGDAKN